MESDALVGALAKRFEALENAVLALIDHHAGTAAFANSKTYQLLSDIREAREEWDNQASSDD